MELVILDNGTVNPYKDSDLADFMWSKLLEPLREQAL